MNNPLENISSLATIIDVILKYIVLPLVSGLIGVRIGLNKAKKAFHSRRENRLFKNIGRPIAIFPSTTDSLDLEMRLLKSVDFFNVELFPADARALDEITESHRLAILRYESNSSFWRIFEKLADKRIPLIIYSRPVEIPSADLQRIQNYYTRYTLCNTPVRLISDVYAIMSVYPEDIS
jgi:hypothetical protein